MVVDQSLAADGRPRLPVTFPLRAPAIAAAVLAAVAGGFTGLERGRASGSVLRLG